MLKRKLIAAATAVALTGSAVATAVPAAAQSVVATNAPITAQAGYVEINHKGTKWKKAGQKRWKKSGKWKGHGPKYGYKHWKPRRACHPIVRWRLVGYRYNKHWKKVVVGWDCHYRRKPWRWY